ncbi:hypothetical protein H5410_028180 [Solanum commersonii]|uniref:Phosphatase PP2A regulatory subunit A/Splicing factor 3B subunit 1-like HEAT repeat domain-containing protein n=1 Tax=Solanum commersonii TaxID=4109 RepID=A0A9J5Z427_SOLCO|nr:hypothetical protein H5410_028180 [Solanum commersonii]
MVMETIEKVVANLGASGIDSRLEELLIDGILYAFQEQTSDDANAICGTIKWRLNNKSAKVRQQVADLISRIAVVMKQCGEEQLIGHLGVVLYEYFGEEYPEVLGSILGALKAIVNVSDRGVEFVLAREWMRVFFELLEMLKAHKKGLKVQECQNRVCTTVAIAIVVETCSPFTVLPALMNEYRVPELNVQNCVLKSLSFLFEYIGEMGKLHNSGEKEIIYSKRENG